MNASAIVLTDIVLLQGEKVLPATRLIVGTDVDESTAQWLVEQGKGRRVIPSTPSKSKVAAADADAATN